MSYSGQTYRINLGEGGLTANPNIDAIPANMMVMTRNVNIHENGRGKRGGTAKVNASAGYGSAQIMGGFDFIKRSGTQFTVVFTTDGKLWKDTTTTIATGMATGVYPHFEVFEDELYISNGASMPQTWDGVAASTSAITSPASDWTGTNYPLQIIKHGYGNSERMWAILPSGVYASVDATPKDFSNTGTIYIPINTSDGNGLVGGVEFGDRLIVFGKKQSYIVDDSDVNTANWGYQTAIWEGGVSHWRLIVRTPNDVLCMMDDGNIYSVVAVQQYGDYKAASITKPSWIDKWIRENCDLSKISQFHTRYDPELRRVYFFIVRTGQTTVDTALVYNIDKGAEEGWSLHDNQSYASGYSASCSWIHHSIPAGHHSFYVYTGDYSGFVWELEETNTNDDSNAYYGGFKTPNTTCENPRINKNFKRAWLVTEPQGAYSIYAKWWVDGVQQTTQTISLAGTGVSLGTFLLDTDSLAGSETINTSFDLGATGDRIQFEFYNTNANEDFFLSQLLIDFKPLGNRPS